MHMAAKPFPQFPSDSSSKASLSPTYDVLLCAQRWGEKVAVMKAQHSKDQFTCPLVVRTQTSIPSYILGSCSDRSTKGADQDKGSASLHVQGQVPETPRALGA
ncbi:hypothetical protein Y1Q_0009532 [Alligator mississippiensis]|uniref:Uncharacterized protein n=1 Tax=Alligator mississippiensis TaxID=8496 RepID=A0A151NV88_ALLMI|nr:hypothetical protein Y1Q_0009532 [Alligator mississippiensis]